MAADSALIRAIGTKPIRCLTFIMIGLLGQQLAVTTWAVMVAGSSRRLQGIRAMMAYANGAINKRSESQSNFVIVMRNEYQKKYTKNVSDL